MPNLSPMNLPKRLLAACLVFTLLPLVALASDFFPDFPTTAKLETATGVITAYGVGNSSGSLTVEDAAGTHDFYIAQKITLEGKPIVCQSPPSPGFTPSKDECPYWPKDVVLGQTKVRIRYWTQVRPDSGETAQVALAIDPIGPSPASALPGAARNAVIDRMLSLARSGNSGAIIADRAAAHARGDSTLDDIYGLALYIASPKQFVGDFVSGFPVTNLGVMSDYGQAIGGRRLVKPSFYPFSAIGDIAASDNAEAFRKLYLAYTHSDGAWGEALEDAMLKAADAQPTLALDTLAALPVADRNKIIDDELSSCRDGLDRSLIRAHPGNDLASALQNKITRACSSGVR